MFTSIQSHFESGTLLLEIVGPTLNTSAHADAIHTEVFAAGIEAMNGAERNPDIHAVLITAKTPSTTSTQQPESDGYLGQNRADFAAQLAQRQTQLDGFANWVDTIRCYPKPVVAALHGNVGPDWMALALASDGIVADSSTVFTTGSASTSLQSTKSSFIWALMQVLPRAMVMEYLSTPAAITAARLHQLGVINRLANHNQAVSTALQWCAALGSCRLAEMTAAKEACNDIARMSFIEAVQHEKNQMQRLLGKPSTS